MKSENSTSGAAPGLGFWINSGLKWVIDASSNLKPWTDQTYNVGSFNSTGSGSGLRPGTVYVAGNSTSGSGFELGKFANQSYELCNDTTNGTVVNGLSGAYDRGLCGEACERPDQRSHRSRDRQCRDEWSGHAGAYGVGFLQLRWDGDGDRGFCCAVEHGEQWILSFVPRCGCNATNRHAGVGSGAAG